MFKCAQWRTSAVVIRSAQSRQQLRQHLKKNGRKREPPRPIGSVQTAAAAATTKARPQLLAATAKARPQLRQQLRKERAAIVADSTPPAAHDSQKRPAIVAAIAKSDRSCGGEPASKRLKPTPPAGPPPAHLTDAKIEVDATDDHRTSSERWVKFRSSFAEDAPAYADLISDYLDEDDAREKGKGEKGQGKGGTGKKGNKGKKGKKGKKRGKGKHGKGTLYDSPQRRSPTPSIDEDSEHSSDSDARRRRYRRSPRPQLRREPSPSPTWSNMPCPWVSNGRDIRRRPL